MSQQKLSVKERIRRGPATKTVRVWIGADLDLVEQYRATEREWQDASAGPADSLEGHPWVADVTARLADLREQLDGYAVDFKLRGLDDRRYRKLEAQHPPRKTGDGSVHPEDRNGWNLETFPAALLKATIVAPDLDEDDWLVLLGDDDVEGQLTSGQLDELSAEAFKLTKLPIDVPFSSAVSQNPLNSGSESRRRNNSGSA